MRVVLITIAVYVGMLLVFTAVRQHQLANAIHASVAVSVHDAIKAQPVDHQHTLFSGVLAEQVRSSSPNVANNHSGIPTRYELIGMSPCNPRIQRCS